MMARIVLHSRLGDPAELLAATGFRTWVKDLAVRYVHLYKSTNFGDCKRAWPGQKFPQQHYG
jgi:hypothetical protein